MNWPELMMLLGQMDPAELGLGPEDVERVASEGANMSFDALVDLAVQVCSL